MKLLLRLSAIVMVVICATWAYRVNYATQEAMNRVADLEEAIAAEREALAVLNAEWAYLNRPDRLRALVAENAETLGLVELTPEHFGAVAMVAFPPEPEAPDLVAETEPAEKPATAPSAPKPKPKPAAAKVAAAKPATAPAVRRAAAAPRPAAPVNEAAAAQPRRPRTLQDLVNAVAGARP